jgi:hypothetical protein
MSSTSWRNLISTSIQGSDFIVGGLKLELDGSVLILRQFRRAETVATLVPTVKED